jgi:hypothetical protein
VTAPVAFSILPFAAPKIESIAVAVSGVDVTIAGAATDVNKDITLVQITILQGPNVIAGVAATGTVSWQGKISRLLPGAYSARAQAFDATGRVSGFSVLIPFTIIDRCVVDTNAHHVTAGRATFTSKNGYRAGLERRAREERQYADRATGVGRPLKADGELPGRERGVRRQRRRDPDEPGSREHAVTARQGR